MVNFSATATVTSCTSELKHRTELVKYPSNLLIYRSKLVKYFTATVKHFTAMVKHHTKLVKYLTPEVRQRTSTVKSEFYLSALKSILFTAEALKKPKAPLSRLVGGEAGPGEYRSVYFYLLCKKVKARPA